MRTRQVLINLLPQRFKPVAGRVLHSLRRASARSTRDLCLSPTDFRRILVDELGLRRGHVAYIHSSASNLRLNAPFYHVLAILREIVGEEGTLIFPSIHYEGRAEDHLDTDAVFDVRYAPTTMGLIAEFARRLGGAVRSLHPTNSAVAVGPLAEDLVLDHHRSPYPCGELSPLSRLTQHDGIVLGLGVTTANLSFVHCVEDRMRGRFPVETLRPRPRAARAIDWNGVERKIDTYVPHPRIKWRDIPGYMHRHVEPEICQDLDIEGVSFFRAHAAALLERMERLAESDVTIYARFIYRSSALSRFT